ncbi:MAG: hypothetical protein CMG13_03250, partial [Candidatus Marinimicrobia bacterium]|nr:hypothetical protein [Candidatus Neomarinimicrobiota bacterium]
DGESFTDALNGVYDAGEDFVDQNGVYDAGEDFVDTNANGVYDSGDLFVDCELGICDGDSGWSDGMGNGVWDPPLEIKSDTVTIIVKAEQNDPPIIQFSDEVQYSETSGHFEYCDLQNLPGQCAPYIVANLNTYISDISDPEDDDMSSELSGWYNDENQKIAGFESYTIDNLAMERYLIYREWDAYGDVGDLTITILPRVDNSFPVVNLSYPNNTIYESTQNVVTSVRIEADIDDEDDIDILDIQWDWSCANCNYRESFTDLNGDSQWDGNEPYDDCGIDGICVDSSNPCDQVDLDGTEGNNQWDEAVFLRDAGITNEAGVAQIAYVDFYPPEVISNSEPLQFTITAIVKDSYQQNSDNQLDPTVESISLQVENVNRPPIVQPGTFAQVATEDDNYQITINDFDICDSDNSLDNIGLNILTDISGEDYSIVNPSQNIIMPISEDKDQIVIDIIFDDGYSEGIVQESFNLNVNLVDDPPDIVGLSTVQVFQEDMNLGNGFTLSVNDFEIKDPDDCSGNPEDLCADSEVDLIALDGDNYIVENGNVVITNEHYFGNITVPIEVSDQTTTVSKEIQLPIVPVNDAPQSLFFDNNIVTSYVLDEDFDDLILFNFTSDFEDIDNDVNDLIPNSQANDFLNFSIEISNSKDFKISSIQDRPFINEGESVFDLSPSQIIVDVTDTGTLGSDGSDALSLSVPESIEVIVLPINDAPAINKQYNQDSTPKVFEVEPAIYNDVNNEIISQQVEIDLSDESGFVWISDVEGDDWYFEITECPEFGDLVVGEVFDDVGEDGCSDPYEDGNGGCNSAPNFGLDGCDDIYEDGEGGCITDNDLNEDFIYISSDPNNDNIDYNGDNYDYNSNSSGTEKNCHREDGEDFQDNGNGVWDANSNNFYYVPKPGFRCTDELSLKVIDDGISYDSGLNQYDDPKESVETDISIKVGVCNYAPEIMSSDIVSFSSSPLLEDQPISIDFDSSSLNAALSDDDSSCVEGICANLSSGNYSCQTDSDCNYLRGLYVIDWNDFGIDRCDDPYEDGSGGCLDTANPGNDGCVDELEDGYGGCFSEAPLNHAYIQGTDPNNDNIDYNNDNYSCGDDGLCPCDINYPGPDSNEGGEGTQCNGQWEFGESWIDFDGEGDIDANEITSNHRYSVDYSCTMASYNDNQKACLENDGEWRTIVNLQQNFTGPLKIAVQADDGQSEYNLSLPYVVDLFIEDVNDTPVITNAYFVGAEEGQEEIVYIYEDLLNGVYDCTGICDIDNPDYNGEFFIDGGVLANGAWDEGEEFEDGGRIEFKVEFEDVDSELELNSEPFDLLDLTWQFTSSTGNITASEDNNVFYIESLTENWNGTDAFEISTCDGRGRNCSDIYTFNIEVRPVNDLPENFQASHYIGDSDKGDNKMLEDQFSDNSEIDNIVYKIEYYDVDCHIGLNTYVDLDDSSNNAIIDGELNEKFVDIIDWDINYNEDNLLDLSLSPFSVCDGNFDTSDPYNGVCLSGDGSCSCVVVNDLRNCNSTLTYYQTLSVGDLKENYNGITDVPIDVSTSGVDINSTNFNVHVLPMNDPPEDFAIDAILYNYAIEEETFYKPCDPNNPDCGEVIHGEVFGYEDNFFRLYNVEDSGGNIDIRASANLDNFDLGKVLFKWNRTEDIDVHDPVSQYPFDIDLRYRIELFESDDFNENPSDARFILADINDDIFDQPCQDNINALNGDINLCNDIGFLNSDLYGWAIINVKDLFQKYQDGYYDSPNTTLGDEQGFYSEPEGNLSLGYLDWFGTTEYKWRVVAYNKWWDYNGVEEQVFAESDDMRFFIDLERPSASFTIFQNPFYPEIYELYMTLNEEIKISKSSLLVNNQDKNLTAAPNQDFDDLGYTCGGEISDTPCDPDLEGSCLDNIACTPSSSTFFYYVGDFENSGLYKFEIESLDLLENAGLSEYEVAYQYVEPGNFASMSSPSHKLSLVIPQYSLLESAGIIISENKINYQDSDKILISDEIVIASNNLSLQSPLNISFSNSEFADFDIQNLRIGRKNSAQQWIFVDSDISGEFISSDIMDLGSYGLFYVEDYQDVVPDSFDLMSCYPNPFNPNINIDFNVPYQTNVNLSIYDVNGNKIKTLIDDELGQGKFSFTWDGFNNYGYLVSSGIYLIVLKVDNSTTINKVTMLK